MKKISILLVNLLCATVLMAAPTITGKSKINLSSAGETVKTVSLLLSDAFSDAFDNTWDAAAANDGGIYIYNGGSRYTTWASNAYSDNLAIGFGSVANNDYVLNFSNFDGIEYKIYDVVANKWITVNASTPDYNFSIADADKNKAINDRFIINYNPAPSFCFKYNKLEVIGYQGKSLVIKNDAGEIDNQPSLDVVYVKDLSAQPADTRLTVTLDSKDYIIDVNPSVTIVP